MTLESICGSLIGIFSFIGVVLFWTFMLTWQQIKFLKHDVERNEKRIDKLGDDFREWKYKR